MRKLGNLRIVMTILTMVLMLISTAEFFLLKVVCFSLSSLQSVEPMVAMICNENISWSYICACLIHVVQNIYMAEREVDQVGNRR